MFLALCSVAEKSDFKDTQNPKYDLTPKSWDEVKVILENPHGKYNFQQLQQAKIRMKAARYKSHKMKMARRKQREEREKNRKTRLLVLNREKLQRETRDREKK